MKKIVQIIIALGITSFGFNQTALNFDGVDDYVQTTYRGILGFANRTFEAWVYVDTITPSSNLAILDYGSNVAGGRNTFCIKGDSSLAFISGGTNGNISSSANAVPIRQWAHVAFVLSSGTGYLYVNGIQVGRGSLSGVSTPFTGDRVKIGERVSGGSIPFKGSIDEVRIWDAARSASQLSSSRNAEFCTLQVGLDAYYRFNEGTAGGTNSSDTNVTDHARIYTGRLHGFALTGSSSNFVTGPTLTPGYSKFAIKDTVCSSYTTPSGKTFTSTGFHFDTLKNAVHCDSLIEYDLTVDHVDDSVYKSGNKLISYDPWAQHQWIDCTNGFAPVSGATNKDFTPPVAGKYAVIVSRGVCNDTSDCIKVSLTSLNEYGDNIISIYPNPVNEMLNINADFSLSGTEVELISVNGTRLQRLNLNQPHVDVSELASGIYFLRINTEFGTNTVRFVKE